MPVKSNTSGDGRPVFRPAVLVTAAALGGVLGYCGHRVLKQWFTDGSLSRPWVLTGGVAFLVALWLAWRRGWTAQSPRPRWRWLAMLFFGWFVLHAVIWSVPGWMHWTRQYYNALNFFGAVLAAVLWFACFSGFSWRVRRRGLAVLGLAVLGLAAAVRKEGHTGESDILFAWRWSPTKEARLNAYLADHEHRPDVPGGRVPTQWLVQSPLDFPQFRGRLRDGAQPAVRLNRDWKTQPPIRMWRHPLGLGWGGFAVVGRLAVTQEQRGGDEMVVAYDLMSGNELWAHRDRTRWVDATGGDGPRATPTIRDGRIYTLGGTGRLNCLDARSGKRVWSVDVLRENDAANARYGASSSPLVVDSLVVVAAGERKDRSLSAYDRQSGKMRWRAGTDRAAYSSPLIAVIEGVPQILIHNAAAVAAHDIASGRLLWCYPWANEGGVNCSQPLPLDDGSGRVLVTTGHAKGCALVEVHHAAGRWTTHTVWTSRQLSTKFTNLVTRDGFLYGLDNGILACLDLKDGRRRWKAGRYGHGQVLLVDDLLIVQAEDGSIALVEVTPDTHRELGRVAAIEGKTWNHPALAGAYLLVRNDREAACLKLPLSKPPAVAAP